MGEGLFNGDVKPSCNLLLGTPGDVSISSESEGKWQTRQNLRIIQHVTSFPDTIPQAFTVTIP